MEYGIKDLSKLAGISTRTLRYYDQIGLLKPLKATATGYRIYGQAQVAILQQILFYKERGFDLKTIQKIIYEKDFDMLKAMEEHLLELEKQMAYTQALIQTVKKTIQCMKGDYEMSDKEKFQAFKEKMIRENEADYGEEARKKYGDLQVDKANQKMLNLSKEQWLKWKSLDEEIRKRLTAGVQSAIQADSEEAKQIAMLHKEWLSISLPEYSANTHKGIAAMYLADERFTSYYDRDISGCARLLHDAIARWM